MAFGAILRELRKDYDLTQRELGDALGISESTVGMYERGKREPNFEMLEAIADYFNVDMNYLTGLSAAEGRLKLLPTAETSPAPVREIDRVYDALNSEGQTELCKYGRYLSTQEQYKAAEPPQIEYIRHYLTAAAAGYASPIEGEDYELVERTADVPFHADFSIDICGDSMEPYIKNGQRVYVQRDVSLQEFDVGIFYVDGDVYCKQWCRSYDGSLYLLSANPAREDANIYLSANAGRACICFGKVLLKKRLPRPTYL